MSTANTEPNSTSSVSTTETTLPSTADIDKARHILRAGRIMLIASIVNFALAGFFCYRTYSFMADAVSTQGTIVAFKEKSSDEGSTYSPVFTFTDQTGTIHRVTSSVANSHTGYQVGDSVEVLYRPDHPKKAHIRNYFELWSIPIVFSSIGTGTALMSIVCLIFPDWAMRHVQIGPRR